MYYYLNLYTLLRNYLIEANVTNRKMLQKEGKMNIKNTLRKTMKTVLIIGGLALAYNTCQNEASKIKSQNTTIQYGQKVYSAKIITRPNIDIGDKTQSLEKTLSAQYFVNTARGLIPITKNNLYESLGDWSMWEQSTKGYERTKEYAIQHSMPKTLAIIVNDTLRPFTQKDVSVSYDGLSPVSLHGN